MTNKERDTYNAALDMIILLGREIVRNKSLSEAESKANGDLDRLVRRFEKMAERSDMAITSGFGMTLDTDGFKVRKWVMKDGVKYWLDECEELPDDEPDFGDHCHDCGEDTCCCDLDA